MGGEGGGGGGVEAERTCMALVKVGFGNLKCVLKSVVDQHVL